MSSAVFLKVTRVLPALGTQIYNILFVACTAVSFLLHVAVDLARGSPWVITTGLYIDAGVLQRDLHTKGAPGRYFLLGAYPMHFHTRRELPHLRCMPQCLLTWAATWHLLYWVREIWSLDSWICCPWNVSSTPMTCLNKWKWSPRKKKKQKQKNPTWNAVSFFSYSSICAGQHMKIIW